MTPPLRHNQLAYAAVYDRGAGAFSLGLAQKDQPGYWPTPQHGVFRTYNEAAVRAHELNQARGLSAEEAALIVASSMRARHGKPRRQPSAEMRPFFKIRRPAR